MPRRSLTGAGVGGALLAALSCARLGYESLPDESLAPLPNDTSLTRQGGLGGSGGANEGGTSSGGVSAGGAAAAASGSGGLDSTPDAGDITGSGGVDAGGSNGGTSGASLTGCGPAAPSALWSFASDREGWQIEADPGASGTLSWTGAHGDPAPGALEIDATVANVVNNVRAYLDQSPRNLTGKVLYAHVFLESGTGVAAKVFVQSGASAWADGHDVYLDAQQWHCVSFDPRDPSVVTPDFDRTAVRRVGVFFFGDASSRLYVDQVSY
jgi:hypothetical protein